MTIERSRALGGKFVAHLPSRHFFEVLDIGFHRLRRAAQDGSIDQLYGVEFHLEKGRIGVLAEFAHASMDIVNGRPRPYPPGVLRPALIPNQSQAVCRRQF